MVLLEVPNLSFAVVLELPSHFAVSGEISFTRNCRRSGHPGTAAACRKRLGGKTRLAHLFAVPTLLAIGCHRLVLLSHERSGYFKCVSSLAPSSLLQLCCSS